MLTARDFDTPRNTGSATATFTFVKRAPPPPSTLDVMPVALDVTQAIDMGPHTRWDRASERRRVSR